MSNKTMLIDDPEDRRKWPRVPLPPSMLARLRIVAFEAGYGDNVGQYLIDSIATPDDIKEIMERRAAQRDALKKKRR